MILSRDVVCPTCTANVAVRVSRMGFLQRKVLTRLGYYPWKCGECGSVFLFRSRGHNSRSSVTRQGAERERG
jgi:predicted RNA-binding Zn-ribbon protein involved in translation (DUF1610 family)